MWGWTGIGKERIGGKKTRRTNLHYRNCWQLLNIFVYLFSFFAVRSLKNDT